MKVINIAVSQGNWSESYSIISFVDTQRKEYFDDFVKEWVEAQKFPTFVFYSWEFEEDLLKTALVIDAEIVKTNSKITFWEGYRDKLRKECIKILRFNK